MAVGRNRKAQLLINEKAIYSNVKAERDRLNDDAALFMVVKANGYGHGAIEVARIAKKAGATGFCVAILDEAIQLREAGFDEPILVLGLTDVDDLALAVKYDVSLTVSSKEWIIKAAQISRDFELKNKIKIHLALDTGMGRIGLQTQGEVKDAIKAIEDNSKQIDFAGIYTHFATADEKDNKYFEYQLNNFNALMESVPKKPKYVHVANSATSLWHKVTGANMIRLGIAGYGLNPSGNAIKPPFELKPALSFTSELVYVKKVKKGHSIGYGATYTADEDQWIGTVPVGYADGVSRRMQGFKILINGEWCPIVGRVCMDQLMVKLPYKMKNGSQVTFVGKDHDKSVSVNKIAEYCDTISYEVICGYSDRLPRVYTQGGQK